MVSLESQLLIVIVLVGIVVSLWVVSKVKYKLVNHSGLYLAEKLFSIVVVHSSPSFVKVRLKVQTLINHSKLALVVHLNSKWGEGS